MKTFITLFLVLISSSAYGENLVLNVLSAPDSGEGGFYFSVYDGLVFIWEYGNPEGVPMISVNNEVQQLQLQSRSDTDMSQRKVGDNIAIVFANTTYTATLNITIRHICSWSEACGETTYNGTIVVTDNRDEKASYSIEGYSRY